jgi:broad specificity phosphatase PhoE
LAKIHHLLFTKEIYLIRHGETDFNRTGIVQGSGVDSSLNENGRRQAEQFFQKYKNTPFEKIYTSTLSRTIQSVQGFIDSGIPHETLTGLNELSWGITEGVPFNLESNQLYYNIIDSWKNGNINRAMDGGESPVQVKLRQEIAIKTILLGKEKLILVCMHGRAMKIMLAWLTGDPISNMDRFDHDNLSLYILRYYDNKFKIHISNDRSHITNIEIDHP